MKLNFTYKKALFNLGIGIFGLVFCLMKSVGVIVVAATFAFICIIGALTVILVALLEMLYKWIVSHKLITALVISIVANFVMLTIMMKACYQRNEYDMNNAMLQQQIDSLRMADVHYSKLNDNDFKKFYSK